MRLVLEFGGSVGAMNSLTDLGGRKGRGKAGVKDFTIKNTECVAVCLSAQYINMLLRQGWRLPSECNGR